MSLLVPLAGKIFRSDTTPSASMTQSAQLALIIYNFLTYLALVVQLVLPLTRATSLMQLTQFCELVTHVAPNI